MTFASLVLTKLYYGNILAHFHRALLPKLHAMITFPVFIRSASIDLGGIKSNLQRSNKGFKLFITWNPLLFAH